MRIYQMNHTSQITPPTPPIPAPRLTGDGRNLVEQGSPAAYHTPLVAAADDAPDTAAGLSARRGSPAVAVVAADAGAGILVIAETAAAAAGGTPAAAGGHRIPVGRVAVGHAGGTPVAAAAAAAVNVVVPDH